MRVNRSVSTPTIMLVTSSLSANGKQHTPAPHSIHSDSSTVSNSERAILLSSVIHAHTHFLPLSVLGLDVETMGGGMIGLKYSGRFVSVRPHSHTHRVSVTNTTGENKRTQEPCERQPGRGLWHGPREDTYAPSSQHRSLSLHVCSSHRS